MYKEGLVANIELTSYCNAGCPQCDRTYLINEGKFSADHWFTFESFCDKIPLDNIKKVCFGGNLGDPAMHPDLYSITEYCLANGTDVTVQTNGSIRDSLFWFEYGLLDRRYDANLSIVFAVDGTTQEMHERYRVGTDLNKILDNMEAASEGCRDVSSFTVVFKHNQDHLEDILALCKKYGSVYTDWVESNRFHGGIYDGLEQMDREDLRVDKNKVHRKVRDKRFFDENGYEPSSIDCTAVRENSINITQGRIVWPCCYLSSDVDKHIKYCTSLKERDIIATTYTNELMDYDLEFNDLETILQKPLYKVLPTIYNTIETCKRKCGIYD